MNELDSSVKFEYLLIKCMKDVSNYFSRIVSVVQGTIVIPCGHGLVSASTVTKVIGPSTSCESSALIDRTLARM